MFNTARQSLTPSSHNFWNLYLSEQYTIKKGYKVTTSHILLKFYIDQD